MTNTVWALARHPRSWAAGLLAALVTTAAVAAPVYRVIDLGSLSRDGASNASAINAKGEVVGSASLARAFTVRPVLFGKRKPLDLMAESGVVGYLRGTASAINGDGHIAGLLQMKNWKEKPFVYRQGVMEVVEDGPKGNSSDLKVGGLSDLGHLLVSGDGGIQVRQPDGTWLKLKSYGHSEIGNAINRDGIVVGSFHGDSNTITAMVWRDGMPQLLLPGISGSSSADAINRRGDIAGSHYVEWLGPDGHRAFVIRDGVLAYLTGPNVLSSVNGMDNLGRVVGRMYGTFDGLYREGPYLFQDGEAMFLDDLVEPAQQGQWQILSANAINDAGEIAARGRSTITGIERALKLVPVTAR